MNIGILVYNSEWWRTSLKSRRLSAHDKLLLAAGRARGHTMKVFRFERCQLFYENGEMKVFYGGNPFPKMDVIIPRPSVCNNVDLELTLNKHLLLMGMKLVNGYMPVMRAKNKIRMLQILSHAGIKMPKTVILKRFEYMDDAIKRVGGFPIIIKTPHGSLGRGVAIVESRRSLLSALDIIWADAQNRSLLIQEYVKESAGHDIRVFVVNNKVIASMERKSKRGDFRSNIGCGGKGIPVVLTKEEEKLALDATRAFSLDLAGVDLLRTKTGPVVMELNANPGLEGITEATGVDVAGKIIDFAVLKAKQKSDVSFKSKKSKASGTTDPSLREEPNSIV
ncbi:MAG: RimK family alpha-L-glutamate ligase [Candidatus Gracilibacteria bacterium]